MHYPGGYRFDYTQISFPPRNWPSQRVHVRSPCCLSAPFGEPRAPYLQPLEISQLSFPKSPNHGNYFKARELLKRVIHLKVFPLQGESAQQGETPSAYGTGGQPHRYDRLWVTPLGSRSMLVKGTGSGADGLSPNSGSDKPW